MNASNEPPFVIGLVGGIASGKSFVARTLSNWGASLFDADAAGHQALAADSVKQAARRRWGDRIFDEHNNINRKVLAQIVFAPTEQAAVELKFLEQLTHPVITQLMQRALAQAKAAGIRAFVLDAPVMLKAGWHNECNDILFIAAAREVRLARAMERGWSESEFDAREAAQELLEQKRQIATVFIENSGNEDQTRQQLSEYWHDRFGVKPF